MAPSHKPQLSTVELADLCLNHLAENPEDLMQFMGYAGLDPAALRSAVNNADFGHGLIDYFASNEPQLLALCANSNVTPEGFMAVWHRLNPAGY